MNQSENTKKEEDKFNNAGTFAKKFKRTSLQDEISFIYRKYNSN